MKQTYEEDARLIEDAVVALGVVDAGLKPQSVVEYLGYVRSITSMKEQMRLNGIDGSDIDAISLLPSESHLLLGSERVGALFEINSIFRLGLMERSRLESLGLIPLSSKACRLIIRDVMPSGLLLGEKKILCHSHQGKWAAADRSLYKSTGKKITITNFRKGEWYEYDNRECQIGPLPDMSAVCEWSRRMCWSIEFRVPGAPAVRAITDPLGVRELLRMRDVPDGKSRRDALRHWVKEHWRQNRKDEDLEHRVREHLRGQEECNWFGLLCTIVPSKVDEAKNKFEIAQGKAWRKRRS